MAIDKLPPGLNGPQAQGLTNGKYKSPETSRAGQETAAPFVQQDSVSLTPEARQLNQMQQTLANNQGSDNSARLEALKKAINDGSYKVDSERLAARMVSLEQEIETLYQ
ncbi:flagellar biosynthesis anti-sigma factor FlgM [Zobellella taiwanensis]|jgi:negative regulator of flagellin synthesis FlgM